MVLYERCNYSFWSSRWWGYSCDWNIQWPWPHREGMTINKYIYNLRKWLMQQKNWKKKKKVLSVKGIIFKPLSLRVLYFVLKEIIIFVSCYHFFYLNEFHNTDKTQLKSNFSFISSSWKTTGSANRLLFWYSSCSTENQLHRNVHGVLWEV